VLLISFLVSACVHPPAQLADGPFVDADPVRARAPDACGQRVRWGGSIVSVEPRTSETCFEVVERPLDAVARPRDTDESGGRFIACAPGFYDPVVYEKGREITVVGVVDAPATGTIGEYEYQFARLKAERVYLWSKRSPYPPDVHVINPWGWTPYWGTFGRPYFPYWW